MKDGQEYKEQLGPDSADHGNTCVARDPVGRPLSDRLFLFIDIACHGQILQLFASFQPRSVRLNRTCRSSASCTMSAMEVP